MSIDDLARTTVATLAPHRPSYIRLPLSWPGEHCRFGHCHIARGFAEIDMRRSVDALKRPTYIEDKDSGELRRPHHIDLKSGMYKGRQVLKKRTEA